jgi:hypothetical protein
MNSQPPQSQDENTEWDFWKYVQLIPVMNFAILFEKFPSAKNFKLEDWNLFITVLAFYICMSKLRKSSLSQKEQEEIFNRNCSIFIERQPNFLACLDDLINFISQKDPADPDIVNHFGFWLAANLFRKTSKEPTKEELEFSIVITKYIPAFLSDI